MTAQPIARTLRLTACAVIIFGFGLPGCADLDHESASQAAFAHDPEKKKKKRTDSDPGGGSGGGATGPVVTTTDPDGTVNGEQKIRPGANGAFVLEPVDGPSVVDPTWGLPEIIDHIDEILANDYQPTIYLRPGAPPTSIEHETVHSDHLQTEEGKLRVAIEVANSITDPAHMPDALAYDIFTEFVAYGHDGNPNVAPAVDAIHDAISDPSWGQTPSDREWLEQNTRLFIDDLLIATPPYLDPNGNPVVPSGPVRDAAAVKLADLIEKHGVKPLGSQ